LLTAVGLGRAASIFSPPDPEPEVLQLSRNGWVPNNDHLPVLIYRAAIKPVPNHRVATFEDRFRSNWWMPQSRNSIYDFHHYHSTAHEVMGFAVGEARLILGGEGGHEVTLRVGDVVVLPAGTGHCKVDASNDLMVIGAYPQDMDWDICRNAPTPEMVDRMRRLKIPNFDPVTGFEGSLPRLWPKPGPLAQAS
jgi:uncharacterized protein YjlB